MSYTPFSSLAVSLIMYRRDHGNLVLTLTKSESNSASVGTFLAWFSQCNVTCKSVPFANMSVFNSYEGGIEGDLIVKL